MKRITQYNEWRTKLDEITPADHRINDDFMLIDDYTIPPTFYEPFILDVSTLIVCFEGSITLNINMTPYRVEAPCSATILAGQIVQYIRDDGIRPKIKAVVMSDRFASELFKGGNTQTLHDQIYHNPVAKLSDHDLTAFRDCLSMIENLLTYTNNPHRLEAVLHLCVAAFYGYFFNNFDSAPKTATRSEQIYAQFTELLKENYQRERSVGFYADKMCLTPKYLSKIVNEISGRTASDWIDDYVLNECKALLKSTDMTVQQISDRMNFSSQAVFGKFFRKCTGLSPTRYRSA